MNKQDRPIFYDPSAKRWRKFRFSSLLAGFTMSVIFLIGIIGVLFNPIFSGVGLANLSNLPKKEHLLPAKHRIWLGAGEPRRVRALLKRIRSEEAKENTQLKNKAEPKPKPAGAPQIAAFYVEWDDTSATSLKQNLNSIDILIPEWLTLRSADGSIAPIAPAAQERTQSFLKAARPDLPILALINNFDSKSQVWQGDLLAALLSDAAARRKLAGNLSAFVKNNRLGGINLDFEAIPDKQAKQYAGLVREIHDNFSKDGLLVSVNLPMSNPAIDYREIGNNSDLVILMAYDEHWSTGAAGPIASQGWFEQNLDDRFNELDPAKTIISLGNYGYDWLDGSESGANVSFQEAVKIAKESEGDVNLDGSALNPAFDYYDDNKLLHHVWFLDAVTVFNEIAAGQGFGPRGYALWRLGSEDPSVWPVFNDAGRLNVRTADSLRTLHYGYDLDYEGKGEILNLVSTPKDGARKIEIDSSSTLITDESLTGFPSSYVIDRRGGSDPKAIALTFDDGPDSRYTSRILDILKQYRVPATFFRHRPNSDQNPALLSRIYREGHEIGNHTFTHPNIAYVSDRQLRLELNATQLLIESQLGHKTLLFRPPYSEDVEPSTPAEVKPLEETGKLGYYTIGMLIDPGDWQRPGADAIASRTIEAAVRGAGNVVLLHDSGGDRSETVEALPKIIEGLRSRGFSLAAVSGLMGATRDKVMPPVPQAERLMFWIDELAFTALRLFFGGVYLLFLLGVALGLGRLAFVCVLAVRQKRISARRAYPEDYSPSISVVVPGYNEEKVAVKTIESLLASDSRNFDIIFVDDGSTDRTGEIVRQTFAGNGRVKIFTKTNGGKASALNFGIGQTDAEIIVALDADTVFASGTIARMVRHFADGRVGAVAGNAKVGNRVNLLSDLQALEYITSQNLDRRAFGLLNAITVVPGAVGAWRRESILAAGGFSDDTLAEDADLTMAILRRGYVIEYDDEAVALTEVPEKIRAFLKQRFRWMFGTFQCAWKHRDTAFRRKYGSLGLVALPNIFIFQIFFPLVSPLLDLVALASFLFSLWQKSQHPLDYSNANFLHILFYYALFLFLDFLTAAIAFALEKREDWRLILLLIPQRLFYRQLMYYVAIKSVITAIRGRLVGWGKLERRGTVKPVSG